MHRKKLTEYIVFHVIETRQFQEYCETQLMIHSYPPSSQYTLLLSCEKVIA